MSTILIAGGTGLVGQRLSTLLQDKGFQVIHLSRKKNLNAKFPAYAWDLEKETIDQEAIQKADYIINLAGAGIADRHWTKKRKKLIIDSRVDSTALLLKAIKVSGKTPKSYIAAAAVGYYGDRGNELMKEDASPGTYGFLSESCIAWENAIQKVIDADIPTAILRIGIVLSTKGGALEKMMLSFNVRVGSYLGNGKQYYSWIHIDDLCQQFIHTIEKELTGVYNAVGPNPATNREITEGIAKAMDKKSLIVPTPVFALRLSLGEMADMLLYSTKVSAEKISKTGFQFSFPDLIPAMQDLIKRKI